MRLPLVLLASAAPVAAAPHVPGNTPDVGELVLGPADAHGRVRARVAEYPSDDTPAVTGGGATALVGGRVIYLNRDGAVLRPAGSSDARTNLSTLANQPVSVPAWDVSEAGWQQVVSCIADMFAPFDVEVTATDPGTTPHLEALFAQTPLAFDMPAQVGGVSPFSPSCAPLENSIVLTFVDAYGNDLESICETMTQEIAHSFGLDHQLLASDPMTYLPYNGRQSFKDQSVSCGEQSPRACGLPGLPSCRANQNSYQLLLAALGPASGAADPDPDPGADDDAGSDPSPGADPGADPAPTHIGSCAASSSGPGGLLALILAFAMTPRRRRRRM